MSDEAVYRSKVGMAFYILFIFVIVFMVLCIEVWVTDERVGIAIPLLSIGLFLFIVLFTLYAYRKTKYILKEDGLLMVSSWITEDIPYSSITAVDEKASFVVYWYLTTALSMDQIRITHGGNTTYISPVRKEEFLTKLEKKLSHPQMVTRKERK